MKKAISVILVLCTLLSMMSLAVSAEGNGCTLTMGVRIDDGNGTLIPAYELARLKYTKYNNYYIGEEISIEQDVTLNGLVDGDYVTITSEIIDERYSFAYYVVYSNGNTSFYYDAALTFCGGGAYDLSIYAVIENRTDVYLVDFLLHGNGSIFKDSVITSQSYRSDMQIGILKNNYASFIFIPDAGYKISRLAINDFNVSDSDPRLAKLQIGWTYAIEKLTQDIKIEVFFDKITKPTISLSEDNINMNYKSSITLEASVIDSNNEFVSRKVWWISSDPNVAVVDQTGTVTAKGAGTATIYAFSDGCEPAECIVNIEYTWIQQLIRILFFGWLWY